MERSVLIRDHDSDIRGCDSNSELETYVGTTIVCWCDSPISFLSRCVPGEGAQEKEQGKEGRKRRRKRTLDCRACKNGQLTHHICNMILLPSSSIVLILNSTPVWRDGEIMMER